MIGHLLSRWADSNLKSRLDSVSAERDGFALEIRQLQATMRVLETENEALASVVARNIKRVEAETAAAARDIAKG